MCVCVCLCVCVRAHMDVDLDIHTCVLLYSGKFSRPLILKINFFLNLTISYLAGFPKT